MSTLGSIHSPLPLEQPIIVIELFYYLRRGQRPNFKAITKAKVIIKYLCLSGFFCQYLL